MVHTFQQHEYLFLSFQKNHKNLNRLLLYLSTQTSFQLFQARMSVIIQLKYELIQASYKELLPNDLVSIHL